MSDIFISYKSSDKERVRILVETLEQQGWSVWWDPEIPPGKTWDEIIEEALDNAKCVIVVWSKDSVKSDWVKEEADKGKRRGILVPVLIDDVKIPLGFGRIEAARLIDWHGTSPHPEFDQLLKSIAEILGNPPEPIRNQKPPVGKQENRKHTQPRTRWLQLAVGVGIIAMIIIAIILYRVSINKDGVAVLPPKINEFKAIPEIIKKGEESTLSWETLNAKEVEIGGIGKVGLSGELEVRPEKTITYSLISKNEQGEAAEREVTVEVSVLPLAAPVVNQEPSLAKSASNQAHSPSGTFNLLASENGGHLVVAASDGWTATIDGKEDWEGGLGGLGAEAVYAFKDERPATFNMFTMLIPSTYWGNIKEFELLIANDSPTGQFESIGKFQSQNAKLFKTPYQEFRFPAVRAKYLKVKVVSTYGHPYPSAYEFQLFGSLDQ